ncbi:MAG: hypothetical protein MN733_30575 [Nitrososphaera sp.]|nr:hypothetical protein [Nitrososphaera sp.]
MKEEKPKSPVAITAAILALATMLLWFIYAPDYEPLAGVIGTLAFFEWVVIGNRRLTRVMATSLIIVFIVGVLFIHLGGQSSTEIAGTDTPDSDLLESTETAGTEIANSDLSVPTEIAGTEIANSDLLVSTPSGTVTPTPTRTLTPTLTQLNLPTGSPTPTLTIVPHTKTPTTQPTNTLTSQVNEEPTPTPEPSPTVLVNPSGLYVSRVEVVGESLLQECPRRNSGQSVRLFLWFRNFDETQFSTVGISFEINGLFRPELFRATIAGKSNESVGGYEEWVIWYSEYYPYDLFSEAGTYVIRANGQYTNGTWYTFPGETITVEVNSCS